jgi:hypothetical protein
MEEVGGAVVVAVVLPCWWLARKASMIPSKSFSFFFVFCSGASSTQAKKEK